MFNHNFNLLNRRCFFLIFYLILEIRAYFVAHTGFEFMAILLNLLNAEITYIYDSLYLASKHASFKLRLFNLILAHEKHLSKQKHMSLLSLIVHPRSYYTNTFCCIGCIHNTLCFWMVSSYPQRYHNRQCNIWTATCYREISRNNCFT